MNTEPEVLSGLAAQRYEGYIKNIDLFLAEWAKISPEQVIADLGDWTCGTCACAGGWLHQMKPFQDMGVTSAAVHGREEREEPSYMPVFRGLEARQVAQYLFGRFGLFSSRHEEPEQGTDYEIVVQRFRNARMAHEERVAQLKAKFKEPQ